MCTWFNRNRNSFIFYLYDASLICMFGPFFLSCCGLFISCCLFVERCRRRTRRYFVLRFRLTCRWERKVGRRWWCHRGMRTGRLLRCRGRTFLLPSDPPQHQRLDTHHHSCCGEKCSWWDGRSSWIHTRTPQLECIECLDFNEHSWQRYKRLHQRIDGDHGSRDEHPFVKKC